MEFSRAWTPDCLMTRTGLSQRGHGLEANLGARWCAVQFRPLFGKVRGRSRLAQFPQGPASMQAHSAKGAVFAPFAECVAAENPCTAQSAALITVRGQDLPLSQRTAQALTTICTIALSGSNGYAAAVDRPFDRESLLMRLSRRGFRTDFRGRLRSRFAPTGPEMRARLT